ncbi:arylsulfatase B-like [Watersipora subatra]|uniref:arylsulfatase B-like n=1 Tax=Watersipora subatra TaxID=2589382 RepID=UPI00355C8B43
MKLLAAAALCAVLLVVLDQTEARRRGRLFQALRRRVQNGIQRGRGRSGDSSRSSSSLRMRLRKRVQKPNIIFIMADDLGWNDVGFHNDLVQTPHLNWLARNGIELTDVHAQPLCSPSRASLMSGKYASNTGLQQLVVLGQSKSCLPLEHKLWPEYMKERGYTTKMVGKWHLGSCDRGCLPTHRGFDEFKGILENQAGYYNWSDLGVMNRVVGEQPSIENIGTHLTLQHQMDVVEMIQAHTGKRSPLFMYISPLAVHQPLEVTNEMFNRHPFLDESDANESLRRKFLGLVGAFDDLVGATIRALRTSRLFENSIVIFTSDNGGPSADLDFPAPFPFISVGNNYPLRGGKSSFYEGGTRSPTIYFNPKLPRRVRGSKRNFLMHISDWLPTTVEMADPTYKPVALDGVSQRRNLGAFYKPVRKYAVRSESLIGLTDYTEPRLVSDCSDADAAYRWRDWKLIYGKVATAALPDKAGLWIKPVENQNVRSISGDSCMKPGPHGTMVARCLFNLRDDPLEQRDLFNSRPDIVRRLLGKIDYYKRESAQPVYKNPVIDSSITVTTLGPYTVPRFDFCNPSIDFPLLPRNPVCNS